MPSEKEIRILIADDHPIVREGLVAILGLETDLKVVGQAFFTNSASCEG